MTNAARTELALRFRLISWTWSPAAGELVRLLGC